MTQSSKPIAIAPSILSADFSRLDEVEVVDPGGADSRLRSSLDVLFSKPITMVLQFRHSATVARPQLSIAL